MDAPLLLDSAGDCPGVAGNKRALSLVSDDDANKEEMSRDDKKLKRVMANRRSARESRERRKKLLANLEASVDILSKENATLVRENQDLRQQLACLVQQAHAGRTPGASPGVSLLPSQQTLPIQGNSIVNGMRSDPHSQTQQLLKLQKDQQLLEALRRRSASQM